MFQCKLNVILGLNGTNGLVSQTSSSSSRDGEDAALLMKQKNTVGSDLNNSSGLDISKGIENEVDSSLSTSQSSSHQSNAASSSNLHNTSHQTLSDSLSETQQNLLDSNNSVVGKCLANPQQVLL